MKNIIWGEHTCVHSTPEITKKEDDFIVLKTSHKEKRNIMSFNEKNEIDAFLSQVNMSHYRTHYICPRFFLRASITYAHETPSLGSNNHVGYIISHSPIQANIVRHSEIAIFRGDLMYLFSASQLLKNSIWYCHTCSRTIALLWEHINFFMENEVFVCEQCCSESNEFINGIVLNHCDFYELSGFVLVRNFTFDAAELGCVWTQSNNLILDQNNTRELAANCFKPIKIETYRKMLFI